jgi:membrane-bound lytic murein transglycosylase B
MHKVKITLLSFTVFLFFLSSSFSEEWSDWLFNLEKEAQKQGISSDVLQSFKNQTKPGQEQETILTRKTIKPQPLAPFLAAFLKRIPNARKRLSFYKQLYDEIHTKYGVEPAYLTAIWAVESNFGSDMGTFPVLQSLATFAYDGPRKDYFRKELLYALQMIQEKVIQEDKFTGSWRGAFGQPQFMPSSWYHYAVDFDQDGYKDVWHSVPDILASIANFLHQKGWQEGQPCLIEVTVPADLPADLKLFSTKKPFSFWLKQGISPLPSETYPKEDLEASILLIDNGPSYLIFKNFRVILTYNQSVFYAITIARFAEALSATPIPPLN